MSKESTSLMVIGFLVVILPWLASYNFSRLKEFISIIGFIVITIAISASYKNK